MKKYPAGKLCSHDDGELRIAVANHKGRVIVEFAESTKWIGLTPILARQLAAALVRHANDAEPGHEMARACGLN